MRLLNDIVCRQQVPQHQVLREGDWKIIRPNVRAAWELYDLARDGTETTNLAGQRPEVVERLAEQWQTWAADCGFKP